MSPFSKITGAISTIAAVLGVLVASDTVTTINNVLVAAGASPSVIHGVGVALGICGSLVALFSHSATGTGGAPVAK